MMAAIETKPVTRIGRPPGTRNGPTAKKPGPKPKPKSKLVTEAETVGKLVGHRTPRRVDLPG